MPSCMSKDKYVRVRISILMSKIISGTFRLLESDPVGEPGRYIFESHSKYAFMYVQT